MFPWEQVDGVWATKSEGVGLIVRAVSFQDLQPMWSWSTNVTDRHTDRRTDSQTDRRHAIAIPRFAQKCIARLKKCRQIEPDIGGVNLVRKLRQKWFL